MSLTDKVAVVTGGAVRVGQAIALALAGDGANVCVHYGTSAAAAQDTVRQAHELGARAIAVQADLASGRAAAESVLRRACEEFGKVDILVNSAAIFEPDTLLGASEEHFDRHVATNMKAPFFLAQALVAQLGPQQRGHILNITDWRALRPATGHLVYSMTKAALVALTKMLALELAPRVQVNALALGAILPPEHASDDFAERIAERIPLRRMGTPRDVGQAVLFLLNSEFHTGDVLCVTGGEHL
jgi:glucose 1-dehydrogenase